MPQTKYAKTVDGVHIAYSVSGAGSIDLVWAPGTVSHVEVYWEEHRLARFMGRLGSFSRLMLFDKRGTGMSDHATDAATLEERMDDIRAVMDACDSERAVLMGISEGAPMCALFAATYPERTVGVVLLGGYAKGLPAEDYPWAPTREEQLAGLAREEGSWGAWTDEELLDFAPSMAGDARFFDWLRKLLRVGASPGAERALEMMNMEVDISNVLPAIRVPALVLHRTGDRICKAEESRYLADRIPGVKHVELPGEDHIPWVGDSDSILREIETFATQTWREVEPDRVLATVMFTDIVGSTTKAAELDIPRPQLSSDELFSTGPGDVLTIDGAVPQASMEDPDQAIGKRAERLAVGLASGTLKVVVATSSRRLREARERPEVAGVEEPLVAGEAGKDHPSGARGPRDR